MTDSEQGGRVKPNPKSVRDINDRVRSSGFARPYNAIGEVYYGIDHRNAGSSFQKNTDHQGLTLFTRPRLNLSYNNVRADRVLMPLLTQDPLSKYRAIGAMLDPRFEGTSDLVDPRQAFMPLLSNTLISLSGFPDVTLNTYTSTEGMRKEAYSMVDDVAEINNTYDITATFANIKGDPITDLFYLWARYQGNVYSGIMDPYPEMIIMNEIDYQTRIWRLILDSTKRYVKKIGCANAAFPLASPLGASFNYSNDKPYSDENDQISIPFRCIGAEYQDPILYAEFNRTVVDRNPAMRDGTRQDSYRKLKPNELNANNFQGYPRIEPTTKELEWWVPTVGVDPRVSSNDSRGLVEDSKWASNLNRNDNNFV